MSLNGLWSSEIYGLFGWEPTGVLIMDGDRAYGGGSNHLSMGEFSVDGDAVTLDLELDFHGQPKTVFGRADRELRVHMKGRQQDGVIEGEACRPDKPDMSIHFRLIRRGDLPR